jgi:hypothetical protein
MKILGPNGFERSYTLEESAGEHQPLVNANVLLRLLPSKFQWTNQNKGGRDQIMCAAECTVPFELLCANSCFFDTSQSDSVQA